MGVVGSSHSRASCGDKGTGVLADRGAEDRRPVTVTDQVRLLLRSAFVDPFKPVVNGDDRPARPDRFEERTMGHLLDPGVDRRGAVLGPVRTPAPAHQIGAQKLAFLVKKGELSGRRGVITRQRLVADIVDQGVWNGERRDEIVNAPILGKASAHGVFSGCVFSVAEARDFEACRRSWVKGASALRGRNVAYSK
jgi:hypothetical protein